MPSTSTLRDPPFHLERDFVEQAIAMDQSDKDRWIWSSPNDAQDQFTQLLESGTLSDAQVRCGMRVWPVHKAIICVRSEWFRKALMGPFKEAETGIVNITEFEENEVDCLLHYIYTGRVNVLKHFPGRARITASIPIWKLGDFFCLKDLCKLALRGHYEYLRQNACHFSASGIDQLLTPKTVTVLVYLVRRVYREERRDVQNAFRPPVVAFLLSCAHCLLFNMEEFEDLLREVPEFALDWAMALTSSVGSKRMPKRTSKECEKCGKLSSKSVDLAKWLKDRRAEFFCEDCFPIPRLEDWTDDGSKRIW